MNIQAVLAATGIPTYTGAWRPAAPGDKPPLQYIVHTYARAPDQSADNAVQEHAKYAYVNLWSSIDPTMAIAKVREAADNAGWGTVDERGGEYEADAKYFRTSWTFVGWE